MSQHRVWVYGDNVNTDQIFPGKCTYTLRNQDEIAAKALEDLDSSFAPDVQPGDIIVAGENWGCGSSREQAVTALKWSGVDVIVAVSFNGLYYRNCINQGVRPVICAEMHKVVRTGDTITLENDAIRAAGGTFPVDPLPEFVQRIIDAGGLVPMLQGRTYN